MCGSQTCIGHRDGVVHRLVQRHRRGEDMVMKMVWYIEIVGDIEMVRDIVIVNVWFTEFNCIGHRVLDIEVVWYIDLCRDIEVVSNMVMKMVWYIEIVGDIEMVRDMVIVNVWFT
eukprot:TRINITY_DN6818_c0_g1_i1.p3 TRINITY_DN6818_c0_g1~~TRINITY_DN6818_c0_g1_i1.p3  ORF type:complete len:115 (-),score=11.44 TRINITY_DN6818_c0_g1_i1:12-356(-)